MKLYTAMGPNPLRVNIFLAEKSIAIPTVMMDIMAGETRTDDFMAINSLGELPVLQLDDGEYLMESMAICGYLDEVYPELRLMGNSPEKRARIRMWSRRIEQQFMGPLGQFGLHVIPFFAEKVKQLPEYAQSMLELSQTKVLWLDRELADGRTWVCDDEFSVADITGMVTLFIYDLMKLEIPSTAVNVKRWESALRERASWVPAPII